MNTEHLLAEAAKHRHAVGGALHDRVTEAIYTDATQIADRAVTRAGERPAFALDRAIDQVVTSRVWGFPIMALMLTGVFWLTIAGANVPSALLGEFLTVQVYAWLHSVAQAVSAPAWLAGLLIDGVYLATAWVVSVMLPPMAIFFPLFTLLEDLGYLPRVAFNLDRLFKAAGAHGKQSLSMMMGWGCNAAGVVATRIIDSPRERLIAIITNNFSICNGRWPTLILMGTLFIGATAAPGLSSFVAAASVVTVTIIGIFTTLIVSALLSRTLLKGEASTFSLELPPYRPPRIWQTIYTSLIDRTLIVLWRAVTMAAPAGALIWLLSNIYLGDLSLAAHLVNLLEPVGWLLGLNGVIILAYIVAIPANELIIPTILMLTLSLGRSQLAQAGVLLELEDAQLHTVLAGLGGWTTLTAVNLMLFSLLHNPCSTTILTIWNETKSLKWTALATLLPLGLGIVVTMVVAAAVRLGG
ncbi:ferrous iron transport protein B [Oscillochloris trichoides DG-6]|uniref:Ferrous iron transport protein B n=1 Tax=Oscillochloris trichoides DG-6 TaxID=765420 RepID=E1IFJ3_9CHLR|nr:nucleoside recognition domain-containing protein [Oscillochloris trichoides]EFO80009.1 ferrous iron transport protein B [Oscillochloris trichoides DG-6]